MQCGYQLETLSDSCRELILKNRMRRQVLPVAVSESHTRAVNMILRLILATSCVWVSSPVLAATYAWDFRNGHFDNLSLVPIGAGAVNLLRPHTDGLHISVPAGHDVKSVGFSPRFKVSGDFEITLDFTIVNRTPPKSGHGSGPNLYLSMGSTKDAAALLGRQLRPGGRDVYGVFAARVENGQRIPTAKLFDVPSAAATRTGRLRLQRTQAEITYSVADEQSPTFRPVATLPVSADDVTLVRVGLSQSDAQSAAEIVLHKIVISANELPELPSEQSRTGQLYRPRYQPPPTPRSIRWLWQSLAALLVSSALAYWLWKRRQ